MPKQRREFLCLACDWIGSPEPEPDECPNCGSPIEPLDEQEGADAE